ncbi:MAG: glycosyltransferase family 2 protein [Microgenomates group bacterium]
MEKRKFFIHFFYALVPITSWLIITMPVWLSPFHPAVVAYFILAFDLYFFYKSLLTVYRASSAYKKIQANVRIKYFQKLKKINSAKELKHFILIPNYKEPIEKIKETIEAVVKNDYPHKSNIYLVLAFEKREEEAQKKGEILKKFFKDKFADIIISFHQLQPNEEPGKASNQTFACWVIDNYLGKNKINPKDVLITVCDADSRLPANYLSYLTYTFLKDKGRFYHFYAGPVLLYGNFWRLPFFVRIQSILSSILRVAFLEYKENFIQISTYSTNFWLLKKINFWDTDIIPEDWHIYLQAFFKYGERVRTLPLYVIINGDAVYSGNILRTSVNRYQQERRWAWGVSDVGYSIYRFFNTPHLNPFLKIKKILFIAENHLLWPTSFFILTLAALIPPLINPVFKRTVLGFLLPKISSFILTIATLCLIFYIYLDIKLRKKIDNKNYNLQVPLLIIQWYFLPAISFIFSSLPALEAHTRLILGKKIKYQVTEKV